MTNIITAIILALTLTNWTRIGTYTSADNAEKCDVMQGRLATNTLAVFQFEGDKKEFVLKSTDGPVVAEVRTNCQNNYVTNWFIPTNFWYHGTILPITNRAY